MKARKSDTCKTEMLLNATFVRCMMWDEDDELKRVKNIRWMICSTMFVCYFNEQFIQWDIHSFLFRFHIISCPCSWEASVYAWNVLYEIFRYSTNVFIIDVKKEEEEERNDKRAQAEHENGADGITKMHLKLREWK